VTTALVLYMKWSIFQQVDHHLRCFHPCDAVHLSHLEKADWHWNGVLGEIGVCWDSGLTWGCLYGCAGGCNFSGLWITLTRDWYAASNLNSVGKRPPKNRSVVADAPEYSGSGAWLPLTETGGFRSAKRFSPGRFRSGGAQYFEGPLRL